jgi:hypothetical protein
MPAGSEGLLRPVTTRVVVGPRFLSPGELMTSYGAGGRRSQGRRTLGVAMDWGGMTVDSAAPEPASLIFP